MPRKSKLDKIRLRQKPAAILRREVHEKYHPGESLPAMRALAMRFDVSTAVVGEALVELANEGLVVRRHGRGVYVTDRNAGARVAVLVDFDLSRPHTSFFWLRATNRLAGVLAEAGYPPHVYVGRHTTEKLPLRLTCPDFLVQSVAHTERSLDGARDDIRALSGENRRPRRFCQNLVPWFMDLLTYSPTHPLPAEAGYRSGLVYA